MGSTGGRGWMCCPLIACAGGTDDARVLLLISAGGTDDARALSKVVGVSVISGVVTAYLLDALRVRVLVDGVSWSVKPGVLNDARRFCSRCSLVMAGL